MKFNDAVRIIEKGLNQGKEVVITYHTKRYKDSYHRQVYKLIYYKGLFDGKAHVAISVADDLVEDYRFIIDEVKVE